MNKNPNGIEHSYASADALIQDAELS